MAQWVKDLVLSLQQLGLLLCLGCDSWPGKLPHAVGMAKKKRKEKKERSEWMIDGWSKGKDIAA